MPLGLAGIDAGHVPVVRWLRQTVPPAPTRLPSAGGNMVTGVLALPDRHHRRCACGALWNRGAGVVAVGVDVAVRERPLPDIGRKITQGRIVRPAVRERRRGGDTSPVPAFVVCARPGEP